MPGLQVFAIRRFTDLYVNVAVLPGYSCSNLPLATFVSLCTYNLSLDRPSALTHRAMQLMNMNRQPCSGGCNCTSVRICCVMPLMSMCLFAAAGFNSTFNQATFAAHATSSAASPAGPAPQPASSVLPSGPSPGGFHASGGPLPQQASAAGLGAFSFRQAPAASQSASSPATSLFGAVAGFGTPLSAAALPFEATAPPVFKAPTSAHASAAGPPFFGFCQAFSASQAAPSVPLGFGSSSSLPAPSFGAFGPFGCTSTSEAFEPPGGPSTFRDSRLFGGPSTLGGSGPFGGPSASGGSGPFRGPSASGGSGLFGGLSTFGGSGLFGGPSTSAFGAFGFGQLGQTSASPSSGFGSSASLPSGFGQPVQASNSPSPGFGLSPSGFGQPDQANTFPFSGFGVGASTPSRFGQPVQANPSPSSGFGLGASTPSGFGQPGPPNKYNFSGKGGLIAIWVWAAGSDHYISLPWLWLISFWIWAAFSSQHLCVLQLWLRALMAICVWAAQSSQYISLSWLWLLLVGPNLIWVWAAQSSQHIFLLWLWLGFIF
ncbi:TPA: hypothetical protein ACH3X3_15309 [Trebouxia sp. C0006]